jgi:hypothetical protein
MLSGERHLDSSVIESYMTEFNDCMPALFWAARWLQDSGALQQQAMAQLPTLLAHVQSVLQAANVQPARKKRA